MMHAKQGLYMIMIKSGDEQEHIVIHRRKEAFERDRHRPVYGTTGKKPNLTRYFSKAFQD